MTTINNEELRQAIFGLSRDVASLQHIVHPGVYEDISKRCELVLSAAKRLLDEGEKCAVLQSQVDNADVTLRQQKLCTEAERSKRQELERTLESVRIVPSPEDIASLRQQLDEERAKVAEIERRTDKTIDDLISERDAAQESLSQAYYLVVGQSPEWSNLWGQSHCLEEIEVACRLLREQAKESTALTTSNQRLREALEHAPSICYCNIAHPVKHEEDCFLALRRAALSQTPEATDEGKDKAIVDWLNEHAVYVPYVTGSYFRIEVATFFKRPPFREAILAAMARKTEGK